MFAKPTLDRAAQALQLASAQALRIATAETCTAGLVSSCLTSVPGASKTFERGFVLYHDLAKATGLGVPEAVSRQYGAVSARGHQGSRGRRARPFDGRRRRGGHRLCRPRRRQRKEPRRHRLCRCGSQGHRHHGRTPRLFRATATQYACRRWTRPFLSSHAGSFSCQFEVWTWTQPYRKSHLCGLVAPS